MRYTRLLENLSSKSKKEVSVRRYSLPEIISESYKAVYGVQKDSNLSKLVEAHLEDVRNNPSDIERLSRQLANLKAVISMVESKQLKDEDLVIKSVKRVEKPLTESQHDEDVEETEDEDLLEETELTDEEVEELSKHLEEIRKGKKKMSECDSQNMRNPKKMDEVRDFDWEDDLWIVVKDDGSFAGVPCLSREEAMQLSGGHEDSRVYKITLDESRKMKKATKVVSLSESSYDSLDLSEFTKKSSGKAFVKTFKKLDKKLHEGTALTRQESIALYKAANSAMTHLSVELEHNPEFLVTFKESVGLLSVDVSKLLGSLTEAKAPSKATMKSLAKFSEALLREDEEEDLPPIEDEENEFIADEEEDTSEEEATDEEQFDQEYADARIEMHHELAEEHADEEDPAIQDKLVQDAEEIMDLPGVTDEQIAELEAEIEGASEEAADEEPTEEEATDDLSLGDDEISDDELEELKKHLTEMRKAKKVQESSKPRRLKRR